jgi:hypothetical protein
LEGINGKGSITQEEENKDTTNTREGEARGQGVGNGQKDDLEELDAAVDTFIRFPERVSTHRTPEYYQPQGVTT